MSEYGGIDVEALANHAAEKVYSSWWASRDETQDDVRAITRAVLQRLAEDGRLGVEKEYGDRHDSDDRWILIDERHGNPTHVRYVGPWQPVGENQ